MAAMTTVQSAIVTAQIVCRHPIGRATAARRSILGGLLVVCGPGDKHLPDYAINWYHPLAIVLCCAIVTGSPFVAPCLALRIVCVWARRKIDQRPAQLYNARMRGNTV